MRKVRAPEERFFAKVEVQLNGCWLWTGGVADGYGRFHIGYETDDTVKTVGAHRWSWEHANGSIPEGHQIDHVKAKGCTSKLCVNPDHLEPVTPRENSRRHTRTITHCPQGHEANEINSRICRDGKRACRVCERDRARRKRLDGEAGQ